ncbi:MAG: hypothetical protein U0900_08065 [Myxococcota bacterium]
MMLLTANAALAEDRQDREDRSPYAIGLWGDLPYSDTQALEGVPNLIRDMNAQRLAFTVHDGDLKGGNSTPDSITPTTCSDELYTQALRFFNSLRAPAMFTPGDNDWTDCDRPSNGGFNSLERLEHERTVLFANPYSLGKRHLRQDVQDAPYVENRRWDYRGVTYVTLNVQGSCNNLCDTNPDPIEFADRNAANIAWMKAAFAHAIEQGSVALMIVAQANPGWDTSDATRTQPRNPRTLIATDTQPDGYAEYLLALREEVIAFGKPVAYVHGDSHFFRVDRPLLDAAGRRLENFTRIETFGDNAGNGNNDVQWVKVLVDPKSREVFAYQAQIVPANRVAVPAPIVP